MLYYTGLRVSPIAELKIADVSFSPVRIETLCFAEGCRWR